MFNETANLKQLTFDPPSVFQYPGLHGEAGLMDSSKASSPSDFLLILMGDQNVRRESIYFARHHPYRLSVCVTSTTGPSSAKLPVSQKHYTTPGFGDVIDSCWVQNNN